LHQKLTLRQQTRCSAARKPTARFRPQLETLERRDVPSTLTVTNILDSGAGSLRADIAAAQSGDTIAFSKSLKGQTITLAGGELLVNKNLTIQGLGAGQLAISGGNSSRVFEVAAGVQATLSGLTIRDGDAGAATVAFTAYDGDGGAILNWGALTVSASTVSGNTADTGGGIFSPGALTVSNSTVSGNIAYRGGGIYSGGTATLKGCTVSDNTALGGYPSGVGWGSSLNWIYGGGGGIWNAGTMTVSGSTLSGNVVASGGCGGGIYNSGNLTVTTSTLSGNSASACGGGIYNDGGAALTLKQDTITQNTAGYGAEIYNLGSLFSKGNTIG
jgi:predicted outer membrane repeat protein